MTVAITGATGLVGSRLVSRLASEGNAVRVLTRNPSSARSKFAGVPNVTFYGPESWIDAVRSCDGVVNLAGEPIATRWTPELKAEIKRSRVATTKKVRTPAASAGVTALGSIPTITRLLQLADAINTVPAASRPRVLVSASAVGFYGVSETQSFDEDSRSGSDYLAEVCREWESVAKTAQVDRLAIVRIGIVLAREGGALGKMLPAFQLFAGGPLGTGNQWFSWIHRDDLVGLLVEALRNPGYSGVLNGTAPNPVRMSEMCKALGDQMGRPSWVPVPDFVLKVRGW